MDVSFYWIVSGIILFIIETLIPVAYFLWFGVACFILSILTYFLNIPEVYQAIVYALVSPIIILLGRRFIPIHVEDKHDKYINKKISHLMGKKITLQEDLKESLQIKIEETLWTINTQTGEELTAGTVVEIVDFDNNRLIVQKIG
ncbi:MAG: NfeD family protein [Proteobacteria bacterium]|nr:NfeD family protein [Pseudomonadota bacterium]